MNKFKGTGVAMVTPFRKDESIDFTSLGKLINFVINNGVNYIVTLGTTSESVTLSTDEKNAIIDFMIETIDNRVPLVVGMGGNNTQEIVDKIRKRNFDGISAILSVCPYYNKPSQKGVYLHYKEISEACPVGVIIYNIKSRTGVNISTDTILKIASDFKNAIGVKEASLDVVQSMQIISQKPKDFLVLCGDDQYSLPLISIGAEGVISVTANAYPAEFTEIIKMALSNNFTKSKEHYYKLFELMEVMFSEGNPSGIKAVLSIKNMISNQFRLPITPVTRSAYIKLHDIVNN